MKGWACGIALPFPTSGYFKTLRGLHCFYIPREPCFDSHDTMCPPFYQHSLSLTWICRSLSQPKLPTFPEVTFPVPVVWPFRVFHYFTQQIFIEAYSARLCVSGTTWFSAFFQLPPLPCIHFLLCPSLILCSFNHFNLLPSNTITLDQAIILSKTWVNEQDRRNWNN